MASASLSTCHPGQCSNERVLQIQTIWLLSSAGKLVQLPVSFRRHTEALEWLAAPTHSAPYLHCLSPCSWSLALLLLEPGPPQWYLFIFSYFKCIITHSHAGISSINVSSKALCLLFRLTGILSHRHPMAFFLINVQPLVQGHLLKEGLPTTEFNTA